MWLIALLALAAPAAPAQPLRGGSAATLTMPLDRVPADAEEWEAFLSLDGGAHYAIRITPHLDLRIRRVTWIVPNVDTAAARIMIRAGDEREETSYELPETFAIVRDPNAPLPPMRTAPLTRAEEGVVAWAEGDRAGTRVAMATHAPGPSGITSVRAGQAIDDALFDAPKQLTVDSWQLAVAIAPESHPSIPTSQHPNFQNILLLSTRMNV